MRGIEQAANKFSAVVSCPFLFIVGSMFLPSDMKDKLLQVVSSWQPERRGGNEENS